MATETSASGLLPTAAFLDSFCFWFRRPWSWRYRASIVFRKSSVVASCPDSSLPLVGSLSGSNGSYPAKHDSDITYNISKGDISHSAHPKLGHNQSNTSNISNIAISLLSDSAADDDCMSVSQYTQCESTQRNNNIIRKVPAEYKSNMRDNCPRRRVLIVDDVPLNRKMLKRLLETRKYACEEAVDGQHAVDVIRESLIEGESSHYDIITMDFQMPVMDGVTATHIIRQLGFKGLIIGVTGNAVTEDVNALLRNGANKVLLKPLSIKDFDDYVNSLLTVPSSAEFRHGEGI